MKRIFRISCFIIFILSISLIDSCKKDKEKPKLPKLSTINVSSTTLTLTTAISGGDITDGGLPVVSRGVCWGTNLEPTITDDKTSDGIGIGTFSSSIKGLSPNTNYSIRAYATTSAGTAYGGRVNLKTFTGTFTDKEGNIYYTVTIGNQIWMAENLAYLPSVNLRSTASKVSPCYYVYNYDGTNVIEAKATENYVIYGVLYNWYAVMNGSNPYKEPVQGVCPTGWHLPSNSEWNELTASLGGTLNATSSMIDIAKSNWMHQYHGDNNISGFSALPAGLYNGISFAAIGDMATWWTSTSSYSDTINKEYREIYNDSYVLYNRWDLGECWAWKEDGLSVRCIKDN